VLWNLTIIGAMIGFGTGMPQERLAELAAWGSVAGSLLQFGIQLPTVLLLLGGMRSQARPSGPVRAVVRGFWPVFVGRGVVQISAYVDTLLGSLLPTGAVAGLGYAQVLYTLPVSLFGMSVSAAELPEMAGMGVGAEDRERARLLAGRLTAGLRQIAFFVIPSAVAFLALGDVIAAALYQSGAFTSEMAIYVWAILAGSAVGLLAATLGRLYASTYYALHDTRTPLRYAVVRVGLGTALGYGAAIHLPAVFGLDPRWGAAGITLASGLAAWVEYLLLRRSLDRRIGSAGLPFGLGARLWASAALAASGACALRLALPAGHPVAVAVLCLGLYGAGYLGLTLALQIPEARRVLRR